MFLNILPSEADRSETWMSHRQRMNNEPFGYYETPQDQAEPGLVLLLIKASLPRNGGVLNKQKNISKKRSNNAEMHHRSVHEC